MFLDSVSQSAYWLRVLLCGLSDWSGGQFVALEGLHQWVHPVSYLVITAVETSNHFTADRLLYTLL